MKIRQILSVHDADSHTVDFYVMTEGKVKDVAVYMKSFTHEAFWVSHFPDLVNIVCADGGKLREEDATAVLTIPSGYHYRD